MGRLSCGYHTKRLQGAEAARLRAPGDPRRRLLLLLERGLQARPSEPLLTPLCLNMSGIFRGLLFRGPLIISLYVLISTCSKTYGYFN